jgi:hypothetical protein
MLNQINKNTVLKEVRKTGVWNGFIAPNKVSADHVNGGWGLGCKIKIKLAEMQDRPNKYIVSTNGERIGLDKYLNEFEYYNCNSELGNRIRFWEE